MAGTPYQINEAKKIKQEAILNARSKIKNPKVLKSVLAFAELKKDPYWWIQKSMQGVNFLINEHQKHLLREKPPNHGEAVGAKNFSPLQP